jgi:hypothetical protein
MPDQLTPRELDTAVARLTEEAKRNPKPSILAQIRSLEKERKRLSAEAICRAIVEAADAR